MTRIFLTVVLVLGFANSGYAQEIRSALDVMTFEDSYVCGDGKIQPDTNKWLPHVSYCQAVEFKPWTEQEKETVSQYLRNINDPRLANFLKRIKEKGITKLNRVNHLAKWTNNTVARRVDFFRTSERALLQVDAMTGVVVFTDSFFTGKSFVDPWAQLERKQLNVLHELVHVFDTVSANHESDSEEFKKAVKWSWNGKEWGPAVVSYDQITQDFASVRELIKEKRAAAGYLLDRELGIKYGFPTVYGMTNSHELFAEILTYYIFDPTAESYLSKEVVQYIKSVLQVDASK